MPIHVLPIHKAAGRPHISPAPMQQTLAPTASFHCNIGEWYDNSAWAQALQRLRSGEYLHVREFIARITPLSVAWYNSIISKMLLGTCPTAAATTATQYLPMKTNDLLIDS